MSSSTRTQIFKMGYCFWVLSDPVQAIIFSFGIGEEMLLLLRSYENSCAAQDH